MSNEPVDPRAVWPRYLLPEPVRVEFDLDDWGIAFRVRFDPGIKIIDRRNLILPPIHLRPDVDPDDTVLDCWSEVDTELED